MFRKLTTYLLTLMFCILAFAKLEGHDWVMQDKAVAALGNLGLYSDSTFSSNTVSFYKEGALFRLLGETKQLHEDDTQRQLYKWYKVQGQNGKIGWLFGDMIVVMVPNDKVAEAVQPFNKKQYDFGPKIGKAAIWIGKVEGRDIVDQNRYSYKEEFLMVTNELGKTSAIELNSNRLQGSTHVRKMEIEELTGDEFPEILLQKISYSKREYYSNLNAEIYSFKEAMAEKVFEETMNLSSQGADSPLKYKYLDARPGKIRFEYIQSVNCNTGKCLKHFTDTYFWNADKFIFENLRTPYRSPVKGALKNTNVRLRKGIGYLTDDIAVLKRDNMLRIIREESKTVKVDGNPTPAIWFYVKDELGRQGYLPADEVEFLNISHAALLNGYYHSTSSIIDERDFVKVRTEDGFSNR